MDQQWEPVVLRKNTSGKPKTAHAVAAGVKQGTVEIEKKFAGGKNSHHTGAGANAHKLDEETETFKRKPCRV